MILAKFWPICPFSAKSSTFGQHLNPNISIQFRNRYANRKKNDFTEFPCLVVFLAV